MTKVEQVARAICEADGHDPNGPTCDVFMPGDPDAVYPWAGYRRQARAAIEAMLPATPSMVDALYDEDNDGEVEIAFSSAILAALEEGEDE